MKKTLQQRFDLIKIYRETISKDPVLITISITALLALLVIYFSKGVYTAQWEELLLQLVAEAHGMILDIIVICILFVWINKVADKKRTIAQCLEDIQDLRLKDSDITGFCKAKEETVHSNTYQLMSATWVNSDYVRLKVIKAIKVLARHKVTGLDLHNVNVSGGKLVNMNFRRNILSTSLFMDCNLSGSNMSLAECNDTTFEGSNLDECDVSETSAIGASFDKTSLTDTNFANSKLICATFKGAYLINTKFNHAVCTGADFTGAIVLKCDFRDVEGLTAQQMLKAKMFSDCKLSPSLDASIKMLKRARNSPVGESSALTHLPALKLSVG